MKLSDFDYTFPEALIAQAPLKQRDAARLMVVDRLRGTFREDVFGGIKDFFSPGDVIVLNDTRVIPARVLGRRSSGGKVEIFVLENTGPRTVKALIKPSHRIKDGETVIVESGFRARIGPRENNTRTVEFNADWHDVAASGHVPLPPYIKRADTAADRDDYQTVFANKPGASASPTAGLHFTRALIGDLERAGISICYVTLHVSYGTFAPVKSETITGHVMHTEYCEISPSSAAVINTARSAGRRIVAVGTTVVRTLETNAVTLTGGMPQAPVKYGVRGNAGSTDIFIYPGYSFKVTDALITNFHLPRSTLLMLVSAFAGRDLIMQAYRAAIESRFRLFSYGDAMLIL